ncbi:PepSY domain-containing protein [Hydrogenimonas sp.]
MVRLFRLHKLAGLLAGGVLFILGSTGFFLDHDGWRFLYTTTFSHYPDALMRHETRLYNGYDIDPSDPGHLIACSKRGIYESFDGGRHFDMVLAEGCNALRRDGEKLYAATDGGVFVEKGNRWRLLGLEGASVNAIAPHGESLLASVDKRTLYLLDARTGEIYTQGSVHIDPALLGGPIKFSRFVRDLHYGRGLLDGAWSLWINDYGAVVLSWLGLSGYLLWWLLRIKAGRSARRLIAAHANLFAVAAVVPLVILAITGIFLDHAKALGGFMRSVTVPAGLLPPVYRSLHHDIWSVDYDGKRFRIGNRYGVFASEDMKRWQKENDGFAYRMFRMGDTLYVSGMGAPNRLFEGGRWRILADTPHMFKGLLPRPGGEMGYFSTHRPDVPLPRLHDVTLYSILLGLHDGTFFASWWVWVNDAAALALLLLLATGTIRWWVKKRGGRRRSLRKVR